MSASTIASALQALAEAADGRLTPEVVLEAARDPDSPLHSSFEWDDSKAAAAHRTNQARALIRSVRVEITLHNRQVSAPMFVRDPEQNAKDQGYVSLPRIRGEQDAARDVIVQEFARAASALRRAREVAAVLHLEEEVDALMERLGVVQSSITASDADRAGVS